MRNKKDRNEKNCQKNKFETNEPRIRGGREEKKEDGHSNLHIFWGGWVEYMWPEPPQTIRFFYFIYIPSPIPSGKVKKKVFKVKNEQNCRKKELK